MVYSYRSCCHLVQGKVLLVIKSDYHTKNEHISRRKMLKVNTIKIIPLFVAYMDYEILLDCGCVFGI